MAQKKQSRQGFVWFLFIFYSLIMLRLLFNRPSSFSGWEYYPQLLRANINYIPFLTIRNYLQVIIHRTNDDVLTHCIVNLAGNVALFIPAGLFLPKLWPKLRNFFRFFLICFCIIFLVETVQLLTLRGSFDVDDIILNLLGMTLGFVLFHIFRKPSAKT